MRVIGKSLPIHDSRRKVTGKCDYVGDMELKGMLHLAVKFSDIPHGMVTSINFEKALEVKGVVDVIYYGNTTQKYFNRYQTQVNQGLILNEKVFNQHVKFVGDRIAAVIAETEEIARMAVKLIEVEYEEYPFTTESKDVIAGKIPPMYEEGNIHGDYKGVTGEKPKGGISVKGSCRIDRLDHMQMETHAAIADYDANDKTLVLYSPNQGVFGVRTLLAQYLDLDFAKVRVIQTTMGGNFGSKQEWIVEPLVALASIKVGRPVKAVYNRHEDMMATVTRGIMEFENEFTVTEDGKILSSVIDNTLNAGALLGNSINYALTFMGKSFRTYSYPHSDHTARVVHTNSVSAGAYRGWTSPEFTTNFEYMMNLIAKKINIDPIELRLKNVIKSGYIDPKKGVEVGDVRGEECLTIGREKFEWDKKKFEAEEFNKNNKRYVRGIGVGLGGHVNGFFPTKPDYSRVDMRVTESGSIEVNVTVHDHGCGTITAMSMIVSEILEIPIDMIRVPNADTAITPMDVGCFSSRTTFSNGRAVKDCAEELRAILIERYADMKKIDISEVIYTEGLLSIKGKETETTTLAELCVYALTHQQKEIFHTHQSRTLTNPGVLGAHYCYVEIDKYTGMTKVLDYLAVHDIGIALNKEICIAQIQGAAVMGIGSATNEHIVYKKNGHPLASLKDYHVTNLYEAPNVKVELIEEQKTEGPFGAKTIGEIAFVPAQAAVMGAINNALDSDEYLNILPFTPDRILRYLNEEK